MIELLVIHDINNPDVMTASEFNYPNWRELRWACKKGEIDALAVVNEENGCFKVFYRDELNDPKTYFEARRVGC